MVDLIKYRLIVRTMAKLIVVRTNTPSLHHPSASIPLNAFKNVIMTRIVRSSLWNLKLMHLINVSIKSSLRRLICLIYCLVCNRQPQNNLTALRRYLIGAAVAVRPSGRADGVTDIITIPCCMQIM
jgi:hypothetical protein